MLHRNPPRKILLVEDNDDDAFFVERSVLRSPVRHELLRFPDGESALHYLENAAERAPDLILLDLKLPKISGHELLQRIKNDPRLRSIPVTILSASSRPQDIIASYDLGANHYMVKRTEFDDFARMLEHWLLYWTEVGELPPRGVTETTPKPS